MMRNKKAKFVICECVMIAIFWFILQCNTNSIVKQVENAVYSDVYYAVSDNGLTADDYLILKENQIEFEEYNWNQIFDDYRIYFSPTCGMSVNQYIDGYTVENVDIHRSYALHNFKSGYIWVVVRFDVVDKKNNLISNHNGGPNAGIKFRIEKNNSEWEIVDFYEQNNYESILEQIYYILPNWNMEKQ